MFYIILHSAEASSSTAAASFFVTTVFNSKDVKIDISYYRVCGK